MTNKTNVGTDLLPKDLSEEDINWVINELFRDLTLDEMRAFYNVIAKKIKDHEKQDEV